MTLIRKGNKERRVPDHELDLYLEKGWVELTKKGEVVEKAPVLDERDQLIADLQKEVEELKAKDLEFQSKDEEFKKTVASLKGEITKLKNKKEGE